MSTMHESIARALQDTENAGPFPASWDQLATAVLSVLATPTPAMIDAGAEAIFIHSPRPGEADDDGAPSPECQCGSECAPNSPLSLAQQGERHVLAAVYAAMVAAAGEEA